MNLEGLDCWDDYPMEHGCICGNDCPPPPLPLDPHPWAVYVWPNAPQINASMRYATEEEAERQAIGSYIHGFCPRPRYSQNREDYAS